MKRLVSLFACAILVSSCGTQDYEKPPQTADEVATPEAAEGPTAVEKTKSKRVASPKGNIWQGLEWVGVNEKHLDEIRCRYRDNAADIPSLGTVFIGGAVIGVVARYSGSVFFGRPPAEHGHGGSGGHGHGGPSGHEGARVSSEQSLFENLMSQLSHAPGAALRGGIWLTACQMALSGKFTPFDGLLGRDFMGLSSALTLGGAAALTAPAWVHKFIGEAPPPEKPNMDTTRLHPENESPDGRGGGKPRGFDRISRMFQWLDRSTFNKPVWYQLSHSLGILFISGEVGYLVYNFLDEKQGAENLDKDCTALDEAVAFKVVQ